MINERMPLPIDNEWQSEAYRRASAVFPNLGTRAIAHVMAGTHPYAIQYLEQAPAIVPFVTSGSVPATRKDRSWIAGRFGSAVYRGPMLRDLLREFHAPLPIRKLHGSVIHPAYFKTIIMLAALPPSELSQAIPERPSHQRAWLHEMRLFSSYRYRRPYHDTHSAMRWAAKAFGAAVRHGPILVKNRATDVIDLLTRGGVPLNPAWTLHSALAAVDRWHRELAERSEAEKFLHRNGIAFDHTIDYGALPDGMIVGGFTFTALRSGLDLYEEGAAMRHCVASYARDVIVGSSRIYSIRSDGMRVATLELRPQPKSGTYFIAQLKGRCNAEPSKAVQTAATAFVRKVSDAARRNVAPSSAREG